MGSEYNVVVPFIISKVRLDFVAFRAAGARFLYYKRAETTPYRFFVLRVFGLRLFIFDELKQTESQSEAMTRQRVRGSSLLI